MEITGEANRSMRLSMSLCIIGPSQVHVSSIIIT